MRVVKANYAFTSLLINHVAFPYNDISFLVVTKDNYINVRVLFETRIRIFNIIKRIVVLFVICIAFSE